MRHQYHTQMGREICAGREQSKSERNKIGYARRSKQWKDEMMGGRGEIGYNAKQKGHNETKTGTLVKRRDGPMQSLKEKNAGATAS